MCSLSAGGLSSFVANPTDLILIRFQNDGLLPKAQRRNYTGLVNALSRIVKEEGFKSLFKGSVSTICRAASLNLGMLATYDFIKETLQNTFSLDPNAIQTRIASSVCAGFFASFFSLPFDNMKTKMQKMKKDPKTGLYPYKNIIHALGKSVKQEGFVKLWVGFPTFYVRIAPHAMITLLTVDALKRAHGRYTAH